MNIKGQNTEDQTQSVLLIDDETELRNIYALHLEKEYNVNTANDGDVPIEIVEEADIVFCDRRMPNQSGEEFLKRIRTSGLDVPVVFISAVDERPQIDEEFQAYLTKPINGETLRQCVEKHTSNTRPTIAD